MFLHCILLFHRSVFQSISPCNVSSQCLAPPELIPDYILDGEATTIECKVLKMHHIAMDEII